MVIGILRGNLNVGWDGVAAGLGLILRGHQNEKHQKKHHLPLTGPWSDLPLHSVGAPLSPQGLCPSMPGEQESCQQVAGATS